MMTLHILVILVATLVPSVCSQCLWAWGAECGSQAVNLGAHATVESCARDTVINPQCGDYFMFSEDYSTSWGCRCCAADGGEEGGSSNSNWDLFDAEGCGATKPPTTTTTTTTAITTQTNPCYDHERGGCWDLGFVDYKTDAAGCQRYCAMEPGCNYWSYHPLRSDNRCHLCSADSDWSTCTEPGSCIWGPAVCPGDEPQDATTLLNDALNVATSYCSDDDDDAPSTGEMLIAAETMNHLIKNMDSYFDDLDAVNAAANSAAAVLDDTACTASATACDFGGVLMLQLRGLLLVVDGDSDRAFPDSMDQRKGIWNEYRVLVADNGFFDSVSLDAISSFFGDLPAHLLSDGVLFDAPFATMTVRDAFKCGSDSSAGSLLGFTNRGFNVFQVQVGDSVENAFPSDTDSVFGDLLMTVLRHEVSHQFDRVVDADSGLSALETLIRSHCDSDDDYLRSQVGHDYFDSAPQEIVASQVGNQYFLDSPAQLRLALHRLDDDANPLPLSWMLFVFELIGSGSNTVTLYKERSTSTGSTDTVFGALRRDEMDRIVGLIVPGCDPFAFYYDQTGLVEAYSGPTDCAADFSADSSPFTESTMEGATSWTVVAIVVAVVALGCCMVMALCLVLHRRKNKVIGGGVDAENEAIGGDAAVDDGSGYDMTSIAMDSAKKGDEAEQEIMVDVAVTETKQ